jgi:hypothetical protein
MNYKLIKNSFGIECGVVVIEMNMVIPFDPANTDYQAYIAWLEEGNQVLPADEPNAE